VLSLATAAALRAAGLRWTPAPGDRFVVADRDMDDEVFVVSDLTIEARDYPTGRILAFNGTTEWALDSVAVEQALWLPWEGQLREALAEAFAGLRRAPAGYEVGRRDGAEGLAWTAARDVEEAYALAVLAERFPELEGTGKGVRHLAELVRNPGQERHVLDLVDRVEGVGARGEVDRRSIGDAGAVLDATARDAYRRRIEQLRAECDDALESGDLGDGLSR